MKKYKLSLLLIFALISIVNSADLKFNNKVISGKTINIVNRIKKINMVQGRAVGEAAVKPKQFDNFLALKKHASKKELIELTNHPNGVVRCYAFWALAYKDKDNLYPIILKHINDNTKITMQFGCIINSYRVGDFFIDLVRPSYVDTEVNKLTSNQLKKLYRILIYTPNKLDATSRALESLKPSKDIYPRIRELVVKNNNQSALVLLAKYKKEKDLQVIMNNREKSRFEDGGYYYTYQAISYFPHPDFLPLLKKNLFRTLDDTHFSTEWRELYKAIAAYKNKEALKLLKVPFTKVKHSNMRSYHLDYVYSSLEQFNDPVYEKLIWKFWEDEYKVSFDFFKYLYTKNPDRVIKLTKKSIPHITRQHNSNDLVTEMLDLLLKKEKEFAYKMIINFIHNGTVHIFPLFSKKAAEIKDRSFIKPLLFRLEREDNPYIYLEIAETLIAYKNKKINKEILITIKKNKNLRTGWGGKSLNHLLEKHKIK